MLNTKLALYDLKDVEAFCNAALDQHLKRWQARLEQSDREDALAYLISETWRISIRYDAAKSPSFTAYARAFQIRFLIQFYRDRFVDTRYKRRYTADEWAAIERVVFPGTLEPPSEAFDGIDSSDGFFKQHPATPERPQDQLEFALRTSTGDITADCNPDLARILNRTNQPNHRNPTRRNQHPDGTTALRAA